LSPSKKKTVLFVDDDPVWLGFVSFVLDGCPFNVLLVDNAEWAVRVIEGGGIDALVTDTNMPGVNGIELVKHVHAKHPKLPILVFFSGLNQSPTTTAEDILKLGVTGVMKKGDAPEALLNVLKAWTDQK
jgi:CheY-like chemotaxis protein